MGAGASTESLSEDTRKALDALPDAAKQELEAALPALKAAATTAASGTDGANAASQGSGAEAGLTALFKALDTDGSGALDADELLAAVRRLDHPELTVDAVNALIREVDLNGDGQIQPDEFAVLVKAAGEPVDAPHLVLNFDVNQTVLMIDSAINAGLEPLLNTLLSNTCWGRVVEGAEGAAPTFELVSTEPSLEAPEDGLKTHMEYAIMCTPIADGAERAAVQAAKAQRRSMLQAFTAEGQPGAPMQARIATLAAGLKLPPEVLSAADPAVLEAMGLKDGMHLFLPSFLRLLRSLKRSGRSFSVCFRTFGKDLPKLAAEYNALCEGTHPLFAHEERIVLDGSDGGADYRMDLSAGKHTCGTWVRAPDGTPSLVLGTIEQPPCEQSAADALEPFYRESGLAVEVVCGADAAIARLAERLHSPGSGCTLALRDYYPAWERSGCKAEGGKPLFIDVENHRILQIFFDDHISAHDAHIVDARRDTVLGASLPISATFGTHLVRAEPLLSISTPDYFIERVAQAEAGWRAACRRRAALAAALSAHGSSLLASPGAAGAAGADKPKYVPHAALASVRHATDVTAADELEDA